MLPEPSRFLPRLEECIHSGARPATPRRVQVSRIISKRLLSTGDPSCTRFFFQF